MHEIILIQMYTINISRNFLINESKYKINYCPGCVMFIHVACVWMCVLFYFSFVCLHVCANTFKFKVHCGSAFEPGASGLPHYCTPPVCVPAVIGALAVWRQNKKQKFLSAVFAHLHLCPLFLCIYIPILTCTYFPTDWFWWRGWLATCTGTAPLFWNFIGLFGRARTRLVRKNGRQNQSINRRTTPYR